VLGETFGGLAILAILGTAGYIYVKRRRVM
jgi:LPXTG-motif cell wall-anchored protein